MACRDASNEYPQCMFPWRNKKNIYLLYLDLWHTGKIFSRWQIYGIFSYFSQKTWFDISCKLSPMETISMKCQILFSGQKIRKNISKCCLLKLLHSMLNIKRDFCYSGFHTYQLQRWITSKEVNGLQPSFFMKITSQKPLPYICIMHTESYLTWQLHNLPMTKTYSC